jgi:hypothetical protein
LPVAFALTGHVKYYLEDAQTSWTIAYTQTNRACANFLQSCGSTLTAWATQLLEAMAGNLSPSVAQTVGLILSSGSGAMQMPNETNIKEYLLNNIKKKDGPIEGSQCWFFTGPHTSQGYGQIYYGGCMQSVHRLAYIAWLVPFLLGRRSTTLVIREAA